MFLVDLLSEDLQKEDTFMRKYVSPPELNCLTLRATGETFNMKVICLLLLQIEHQEHSIKLQIECKMTSQ